MITYSYLIKQCMSVVCNLPQSIGLCECCSNQSNLPTPKDWSCLQKQTRYRGFAGGQILVSGFPRLSSLFPIRPGTQAPPV
jgi:hypothetical protein